MWMPKGERGLAIEALDEWNDRRSGYRPDGVTLARDGLRQTDYLESTIISANDKAGRAPHIQRQGTRETAGACGTS